MSIISWQEEEYQRQLYRWLGYKMAEYLREKAKHDENEKSPTDTGSVT